MARHSIFTGESYRQLGSVDTFHSAPYIEHFLRLYSHLLPFPVEACVQATLAQFHTLPHVHAHDRPTADLTYFGAVQPSNGRAFRLGPGDLLLVDNRRYTHAVCCPP